LKNPTPTTKKDDKAATRPSRSLSAGKVTGINLREGLTWAFRRRRGEQAAAEKKKGPAPQEGRKKKRSAAGKGGPKKTVNRRSQGVVIREKLAPLSTTG